MTDQEIQKAKNLSSAVASLGKSPKPILRHLNGYIPTPEKEFIFETPESIASKLNSLPEGSLGSHLIKEKLTAKDVIEELRKLSGNDRLDISNIRNGENLARAAQRQTVDMNDMRWHGAGGANGASLSGLINADIFTSTSGQTAFVASSTPLSTIGFWISGALQTPTTDYTVAGSVATVTAATWPSGTPPSQPVVWVYIHA